MTNGRPLIGVTGPQAGGLAAWLATRFALYRAGGRALRITPGSRVDMTRLDGLIIGGGADIGPLASDMPAINSTRNRPIGAERWRLSGIVVYPLVAALRLVGAKKPGPGHNAARDKLEFELLDYAAAQRIPTLGICRGAQLINAHCGGSLHRELSSFYTETPAVWSLLPRKLIDIEPGSRLAKILRHQRCRVNALHRQAIKDLGEGLRVTAREPTGVIQGIEHRDHPFLIGVQWHPEYLPQYKRHLRLFRAITSAARQYAVRCNEAAMADAADDDAQTHCDPKVQV